MSTKNNQRKEFPDFFSSKSPISTSVIPLQFKNKPYWLMTINKNQDEEFNVDSSRSFHLQPYEDNDEGLIECGEVEETYEITQTKSGNYITSFYVPGPLQAVIIGSKGRKLRSLEERTKCHIKVPRVNEKGDVKITGNTERAVASCRNQVAMIVLNKRDKMVVSHFVSVPMFSEEIKGNFSKFQQQILDGPQTRGIDASIFQKPEKLHLTIATLSLLDDVEIEDAKKILKNCYQEVMLPILLRSKTYSIIMRGIEIMNDDPSDVNVLYGRVMLDSGTENDTLQKLANDIVNYLHRKGLIKKQYENVKLHITLMNSLFRQKIDDYEKLQKNGKDNQRETFDATHILKDFKDFVFGKTAFKNIHLSIRFSTGDDGYYNSALILPIR